jgi:hypothetical protein
VVCFTGRSRSPALAEALASSSRRGHFCGACRPRALDAIGSTDR